MNYIITNSEMVAAQILRKDNGSTSGGGFQMYKDAGDEIILLAEKIKSERMNCIQHTILNP